VKIISIIKYAFSFIGICLLAGAFFIYQNTSDFISHALTADGTVIEYDKYKSDGTTMYSPVVRFTTAEGIAIEFRSSVGTSSPPYSIGDTVGVLYLPANPEKANINSISGLWTGAIILSILGSIFFLIGFVIIFIGFFKQNKAKRLKEQGQKIKAKFQSVERNLALSVNGKNPYQILSQWQNPKTKKLHIFKSDDIWFDPSDFITENEITVFIERDNPNKYHVDISFLPEVS